MTTATARAWDAPPVLDGPSFTPAHPLEEAKAAALVRDTEAQRRADARRHHLQARHDYVEAVRQAEARELRRRVSRLEQDRDRAAPLLRDGVVGAAAVTTPLLVLSNSAQLRPELRHLASCAAVLAGLLAGREWMQHQHERRVHRLDDELDRLQSRLTIRSIPEPLPLFTPEHR